jgi:hypothetical protein
VELDITAADMWADTEPPDLYEGPGAFTARQLAEVDGVDPESARKTCDRMARQKTWVQVKIRSDTQFHRFVFAWVKTEIYDEWMNRDDAGAAK